MTARTSLIVLKVGDVVVAKHDEKDHVHGVERTTVAGATGIVVEQRWTVGRVRVWKVAFGDDTRLYLEDEAAARLEVQVPLPCECLLNNDCPQHGLDARK